MDAPSAAAGDRPRPAPAAPSRTRSQAAAAFRDSTGAGLGFLPLGLAFGALATQSGLDWWWAGLSATLVFAGSFEFLLIGMVGAAVPPTGIAVSAFLVNVRHVFFALSFPLDRVKGPLGKAYSTFTMCDEVYALTTGNGARSWSGRRVLWLQFFLHVYWAGSSTIGALLGSLLPGGVSGLDFALTALFAVLALDAARDLRGDPSLPVLALLSALAARLLLPSQMLPAAFALFTAALLTRHLATGRKTAHV
jgi:4-azaleucine resistance transporter AzlC